MKLKQIPTHVITGFLGAGKTTLIRQLLAEKPEHERWAVLVNEFGEIGLDAQLMKSATLPNPGQTFIQEVTGGCMCCTAGVPMTTALNQLLKTARPDRLLIEPTGLGHPKEVLAALQAEHYRDVLTLHATVTLVDARNIQIPRYTNHATFRQQIEIADWILASKADQYGADDLNALTNFVSEFDGGADKPIVPLSKGKITGLQHEQWLSAVKTTEVITNTVIKPPQATLFLNLTMPKTFPATGFEFKSTERDGYFSAGWLFATHKHFNAENLKQEITSLPYQRLKAILNCGDRAQVINRVGNEVTVSLQPAVEYSRLEVISDRPIDHLQLQQRLLNCLQE